MRQISGQGIFQIFLCFRVIVKNDDRARPGMPYALAEYLLRAEFGREVTAKHIIHDDLLVPVLLAGDAAIRRTKKSRLNTVLHRLIGL